MQLLARVIPVTGFVALLGALMCEPQAYALHNLAQRELILNVLLVSAFCTVMQYAEWKLVQELSFVAFNVLSSVHQIPLVLAGVMWDHDVVDTSSAVGFGACIVGGMVYAAARSADAKQNVDVEDIARSSEMMHNLVEQK